MNQFDHLLYLGRKHVLQFGTQRIQVGDQDRFGTVLDKIDKCSSSVGLQTKTRIVGAIFKQIQSYDFIGNIRSRWATTPRNQTPSFDKHEQSR